MELKHAVGYIFFYFDHLLIELYGIETTFVSNPVVERRILLIELYGIETALVVT